MTALQAALLGIVQGLTEFLPVSSSGHLVLAEALLGVSKQDITFEVFLHFGTFVSVIVILRTEVWRVLRAFFKGLRGPGAAFATDNDFRMAIYVLVASAPAGVIGVLFEKKIEGLFENPLFVCLALLWTAAVLFSTRLAAARAPVQLSTSRALLIGCAQALAIPPGISRSGMTISGGLWLGLPGEVAGRFSFLMSLPVILGATLLKARKLIREPIPAAEWVPLLVGTVAACITGIFAMQLLLAVLRTRRFSWFGAYCAVVGIAGAALLLCKK